MVNISWLQTHQSLLSYTSPWLSICVNWHFQSWLSPWKIQDFLDVSWCCGTSWGGGNLSICLWLISLDSSLLSCTSPWLSICINLRFRSWLSCWKIQEFLDDSWCCDTSWGGGNLSICLWLISLEISSTLLFNWVYFWKRKMLCFKQIFASRSIFANNSCCNHNRVLWYHCGLLSMQGHAEFYAVGQEVFMNLGNEQRLGLDVW